MWRMRWPIKYSSMLESNLMKDRINQALGVDVLPGTITATVEGETNLLQVTATSSSPRMAFEMVRAVDAHYPELGQHIDQNAVLHVMTNAQAPVAPSNLVNTQATILLAAVLGWRRHDGGPGMVFHQPGHRANPSRSPA